MKNTCAKHIFPEFYSEHSFTIMQNEHVILTSSGGSSFNKYSFCAFGDFYYDTRHFCEYLGMSDVDTVFCLLKYGVSLPMYED